MTDADYEWQVARRIRAEAERDRLRAALEEIAEMPTEERNPDGDEQAACSMQLVARETLRGGHQ